MKIVVLEGYASNPHDLDWDGFAQLGDLTVYDNTEPDQIIERSRDAEIVFINKAPMTAEVIAACPKLRMIGILATGFNVVDLAAATAHGITVCNVPGYSTHAVAQMTWALLLEATQQVGLHNASVHAGQWQASPIFCYWNTPLVELLGKTMGIVGYGAIGQTVGKIAQAFGMRLLVTARHPKSVPEGAEFVALPELLRRADVVSLHCPQTADNYHMIDAAALASMKDGAILLNTARGGLIDEAAVAAALQGGKLAYYGADVVSKEPIDPQNPLLTAPRCFLTPHIAWAPRETRIRLHAIALQNLRAFLSGAPQNVVNP